MIPTKVVFIIRMPSVKMEMSWVSLATYNHVKKKDVCLLHCIYVTDSVLFHATGLNVCCSVFKSETVYLGELNLN